LETGPGAGIEVHAASWARRREVVLDAALAASDGELARIATHELFHFVWLRMNNRQRRAWGGLLAAERTRGELGWSSEWRRRALTPADALENTGRWREYVSESFCDTGAWIVTGLRGDQDSTPGKRWLSRRKRFFDELRSHWNGVWRI
jgi:hypothetical protein